MDLTSKRFRIPPGVNVGISSDGRDQIAYAVFSRLVHQFLGLADAVQFGGVVDVLYISAIQPFFHGYLPNVHAALGQRRDPGAGASGQCSGNKYQ
jgi:hypothetical protein